VLSFDVYFQIINLVLDFIRGKYIYGILKLKLMLQSRNKSLSDYLPFLKEKKKKKFNPSAKQFILKGE
jgi:hypothetical protein